MISPVLGHSTGQVGHVGHVGQVRLGQFGQVGQAGTYTGGQRGEGWNGEELGVVPGIEKYDILYFSFVSNNICYDLSFLQLLFCAR